MCYILTLNNRYTYVDIVLYAFQFQEQISKKIMMVLYTTNGSNYTYAAGLIQIQFATRNGTTYRTLT